MAPRNLKSDLTAPRRHLVEVMQEENHACIENLAVIDGEPVFTDDTRVVRKIRLDKDDNEPRPERALPDTELRREVVALFGHLDRIGNGVIRCLGVAGGLPRHLEVLPDRHVGLR